MSLCYTHLTSQNWHARWYEVDPDRLMIEKEAMRTRFPGFDLTTMDDGKLAWRGVLTTNTENKYEIAVIYPHDFPYNSPFRMLSIHTIYYLGASIVFITDGSHSPIPRITFTIPRSSQTLISSSLLQSAAHT